MPKFLFFDTNSKIIESLKYYLLPNFSDITGYAVGQIQDLSRQNRMDAIVSPANSFGFMDGGIDRVYMMMFDNIENIVKLFIEKNGIINSAGQPHFPVGSAFFVPVSYLENHHKFASWLISAPTMYLPDDIQGTQNVYYSFLGILHLTEQWPDNFVIAVPGLGTGIGCIDPETHATQILKAFNDFKNKTVVYPPLIEIKRGRDFYLLSQGPCEQRDYYSDNDNDNDNDNPDSCE